MITSKTRLLGETGKASLGLIYLIGTAVHVYFWATNRAVYGEMTQFIVFDWYRGLWMDFVLPNLGVLLPLLAGFEAIVALAILSKGRLARIGLIAGAGFNLAVSPLGFWWPSNIALAALHIALLRFTYPSSTIDRISRRFDSPKVVR